MDPALDRARIGRHVRAAVQEGHDDVLAVYLFGSTARDARREDSDVDLGVLLGDEAPTSLDGLKLDLEGELERRLDLPVQVVVLDRAAPDLVHRVLRDGELLVDRDPAARIRFEVRARNEFFDLEPVRRRYRRPAGTMAAPGADNGGR
jgi:predicted nucleotidyltransferase